MSLKVGVEYPYVFQTAVQALAVEAIGYSAICLGEGIYLDLRDHAMR